MYQNSDRAEYIPPAFDKGKRFYMGSWTGRIFAVNVAIFVLMSLASGSIFSPTQEVLLQFGAQDPVRMIKGEWWRLFTPIFVHIGIIHVFFNQMALKYIGPDIETLFGPRWFLFLYLVCGIVGNVSSASFNEVIGAGASGAIFGLIGAGLVTETYLRRFRTTQAVSRRSAWGYTSLAGLNLALGFLIPGIDNAAHVGGFITGIVLTAGMLKVRPNRLTDRRPAAGIALILAYMAVVTTIGIDRINAEDLIERFESRATSEIQNLNKLKDTEELIDAARNGYFFYTRALDVDPDNHRILLARGQLLVLAGDVPSGLDDLRRARSHPNFSVEIEVMARSLERAGRNIDARLVRGLVFPQEEDESGSEDSGFDL